MSMTPSSGLGSLAQSARSQTLRGARTIFILIGIFTLGANIAFVAMAESMVESEFKKEIEKGEASGLHYDQAKLDALKTSAVRLTQLANGAAAALGVIFILFGIFVHFKPVIITVLGLVIYVASYLAFGLINPISFVQGILIKIVIVLFMIRAISAAIAYERERKASIQIA